MLIKKNFYPIPKVEFCCLEFDPLKKDKIQMEEIHQLEKITNFFLIQEEKKKKKIETMFSKKQIEDYNLAKFLIIDLKIFQKKNII